VLPHRRFERLQIARAHRLDHRPMFLLRLLHAVHENAAEEI